MHFALKVLITAVIVAAASELAKRNTTAAAMLIALPLTSILAMIWLYVDTRSIADVDKLSISIFWLVLPTLAFFGIFSYLARHLGQFWPSLGISCALMVAIYLGFAALARRMGLPI